MRLLPVSLLLLFFSMSVYGQSVDTKKKDLKSVEKQIQEQKKAISEIESKKKNVLGGLQQIEKKKDQLENKIRSTQGEVEVQEDEISKTQSKIVQTQNNISTQKDFMKAHLQHLYMHGSMNVLQTWFQKMDYDERRRQNVWITHWVEKERVKVGEYQSMVDELSNQKQLLEKQVQNKQSLLQDLESQKNDLDQEKKKKNTLLASIKNQKSLYEQSLKELESTSLEIQKMINRMSILPSRDGTAFEAAKGLLITPVDGKIERGYGPYEDQTLKANVYHKGIDYKASFGQEVRSVFEGSIVYTGWFEGYGKVVIVDHGNHYYSLYAHLSSIDVNQKDRVSKGTIVGKVGDTGSLKGAYLYFELRKKGVTIDPKPWFS